MTKKQEQRSSRRKNGIRIRETAPRQYEADFTVSLGDGKRLRFRRVSPVRTIEGTRAWAEREREAIVRRGGKARTQPRMADPSQPRSFHYWGRRWYADAEALGHNQPSTLNNKRWCLTHLDPVFGSRAVTSVEPSDVHRYVVERRRAGVSHSTLRLELVYLKAVLRHAQRHGTPLERQLQIPEFRERAPAEACAKLPVSLSEEETRALLARAEDSLARALLTCLFRQGMRVGEVLGLRWGEDIDFAAKRIQIQRAWREQSQSWGPPKSRRARTNAIDPETLAALIELGEGAHGELVFPRLSNPERPLSPRIVTVRLKRAAKAAGLSDKISTKTGRHSFGRHWAERGWPMRGLQEFLGHHSVTVTQIYAHWSVDATASLLASRLEEANPDPAKTLATARALLEGHGLDLGEGILAGISALIAENTEARRKLEDSGKMNGPIL